MGPFQPALALPYVGRLGASRSCSASQKLVGNIRTERSNHKNKSTVREQEIRFPMAYHRVLSDYVLLLCEFCDKTPTSEFAQFRRIGRTKLSCGMYTMVNCTTFRTPLDTLDLARILRTAYAPNARGSDWVGKWIKVLVRVSFKPSTHTCITAVARKVELDVVMHLAQVWVCASSASRDEDLLIGALIPSAFAVSSGL